MLDASAASRGRCGECRTAGSGGRLTPLHALRGRTARNAAWLLVVHGTSLVFPLATVPHLTRTLGPEGFGLGVYLLSFAGVVGVFLDYGFNVTAVRDVAVASASTAALRVKVSGVFWAKIILLGLAVLASAGIILAVPRLRQYDELAAVAILGVAGTSFSPVWIYQGLQEAKAIAGVVTLARIGQVGGIFVFVRGSEDTSTWLSLVAGFNVIVAVILWVRLAGSMRLAPGRPNWRRAVMEIRGGTGVFVSQALIASYTVFNTFLVGSILDLRAAGLYAAAERLVRTAAGLLGPVNQALAPTSSQLAVADARLALQRARRSLRAVTAVGAIASAAVALAGPYLITVVFGSEFLAAADMIWLLAPIPTLVAASGVLSWQFIIAFQRDASLGWSYAGAALVNVCAALILVPRFGAVGMAVAVVLAESYVVAHQAMSCRKLLSPRVAE